MSRAAAPASFFYIAVRAGGGKKFGVRQARSAGALAEMLRRESLLLLKWWRLPEWAVRDAGMTLKDHAALNDQLAQLLGRGVPLVEALEVTATTVSPAAKARVERMRELVAAGSGFADACRTVGGFDEATIAVYRGAERTGDLAGAARRLAETMRRRLAVSGKAATLMIYPSIVLTISIVVGVLMLMFVVPRMGEALQQADVKLPRFSQVVMNLGGWMRANATWLAIGVAGAAGLVLVGRGAAMALVGRVSRRIPLLRDVILAQESARFFAVMAAMVKSGVPLAEALGVANTTVGHPALRAQLERLRTRLIAGGVLRTLIEEVSALPLATRRLLIAAERSGDLETAFSTLSADMAEEVDRRSQRLLAVLEPLLIVFIFLVIGTLLMAILLPMLTMSGRGVR